ncbi:MULTISPECIES: YggT family protein [Psychrobacillus]|jgi:YggT family protein|uniref:YggT family protein n=1 Tax=Psychrobacillus faecigallinarum TaxID=2762235 RepID=A0ABR8R4R4_9BACI|nr:MULTISPECIES: YggT family protein [Psychrobacillus]MBD7942783.1 YggT family protein [Psychrobacillus faecigallinarum]QEY20258.1 YggT family protein [Psychrobacillus sp. AK 1817]QGM30793.1 YggT family protein [Bacillus sp. N3536]
MDLILVLLAQLVQIYSFALIIYIFMSWVPNVRESAIGQFLGKICEPYLEPFRKIIPPIGMIDISPIVAIFVLNIAMRGILSLGQFI